MKALSIAPDWMNEFILGYKTIECRTWLTDYRGKIALCSTAKKIHGTIPGHALLIGNLADVVPFKKEHLEKASMNVMPDVKSFAWIFDKIEYIRPIPVKGKLGLWEIDIDPEVLNDDISDEEIAAVFNPLVV